MPNHQLSLTQLLLRRLPLFSLLLVISQFVGAQSQEVKDSLIHELQTVKSESRKVDILNALANEYYDFDDSIGFYYARQALVLAKKIDYPIGLQYAYTMVGIGHYSSGDYINSLQNFELSHATPFGKDNVDHYLYNIGLAGSIMSDLGMYDSAKAILEKGLLIALEYKRVKREAAFYKALARIQTRLWQNEEALKNLIRADSLNGKNPNNDNADFAYHYATIYLNQSDLIRANTAIQVLCTSVVGKDDYYHKSLCKLTQSELNRQRGEYTLSINNAFQALEISEIFKYPYLRAQILLQIGIIYKELSEHEIATEFLFRALKITEPSGIDPLSAITYSHLGWVFMKQNNFDLALEYIGRSETISRKIGDRKGISNSLSIRGIIYFYQKEYSKALREHGSAMVYRDSINDQAGIAATLYNIAKIYEEQNHFSKALELQMQSLKILESLGNPLNISLSYQSIARLLIKMDRLQEAESYLLKSDKLATKTNSKIMWRANYDVFAQLYAAKGDYQKAYSYAQKFKVMNDSIFAESNNSKIAEMQSLYDVERKEQQIELLSKERTLQLNELALQKSRITNQNLIIIFGSIAFVLVALLLYSTTRSHRKLVKTQRNLSELNEELMTQSEELRESNDALVELNNQMLKQQDEIYQQAEELRASNNDLEEKQKEIEAQAEELIEANATISSINQHLEEKVEERTEQLKQAYIELDTFFYRSSHDFRRPITTFIGLAEVAKITSKDENTLELFSKVKETALSLDRMIRKLQTISDVGAQQMVFKEVLIRELISNILDTHKDELQAKGIKVIQEVKLNDTFKSYGALVNVVMENLIENSIQFATPLAPFIKISAFSKEKSIVLQVEDNGHGIPVEYHERIFDMYFRASVSSKGNGLGLYIVKKAVDKLEGAIRFETNFNVGTNFIVELPIKNS